MLGYFIGLIVLVLMSAFFSAAEIAIFSTTAAKLRAMVEKNIPGAKKLEYLKTNPKKTLVTILVGNNIANIAASAIATMLAIKAFGDIGTGIATGAMVLVILVFGEIVPKSYATHNADKIAVWFAPILIFLMKALYPVILLFELVAIKLTKTGQGMNQPIVTEEELKATLEMSAASGNVRKEEKEMIESVLRFNDITVREVMTHRSEMICLDSAMKLSDAAGVAEEHQFSRYPVFKKSKENIVGVVHIKDMFLAMGKGMENKPVISIMSKIEFVPQHMLLNQLFKEFQNKQMHMAVVVNDHGELIGVATLEDLLEELVGEIIDESDVKQHLIKRLDKQTVLAHGMTELRALNRFFHTTLPGASNDSLSKIILKNIKKFPKQDEVVTINQNEITIVEATPKKIIKVKIKKLYE
ncbi:MAG: hemolysin family protein [Candidatus Nanoarchaeia archaeon]|nr:hemolysin family protein [Candidatus Nanoarchaeia archaeon]